MIEGKEASEWAKCRHCGYSRSRGGWFLDGFICQRCGQIGVDPHDASLALTREQVADLTARWPVAGIALILRPAPEKASLEFRFTMPTGPRREFIVSLDYDGGARRYDVLGDARWQLAGAVFELGYPAVGSGVATAD